MSDISELSKLGGGFMRWDDLIEQVEETVQGKMEEIKNLSILGLDARSPKDFYDFEHGLMALSRGLAGEITQIVIVGIFDDAQWQDEKVALAKGARSDLRYVDTYDFKIQTLSGCTVKVPAKYIGPKSAGKTKTRKGKKIKRNRGAGFYPAPASLGISHHRTPALMSEITRQVVESSSEEEARESLARRGIDLDIKTVWRLINLHGEDSLKARDEKLAVATGQEGEMSGMRVVAAVDGGRIRMRKNNKRGRKPKGKKRRRFKTPWQEPKVLTIYVVDAEGQRDRSIPPIIDGTMGNADAVTSLLVGYLRLLGVKMAEKLVIIGDGARWIWNRVSAIIEGVGIDPKKVTAIVDFYHAVEHLQSFADLKTGWSEKFRKQWVTKNRKLLRRGKIMKVIETLRGLASGRNAKKLTTELNYFVRNAAKMKYAWFKRCRLPIGSGAVESCIRRVVNLRMKSPSTFWDEENAEGFMHLRALYKSGRWDEIFMQTLEGQAIPEAA
jgi:hypothetical protein